MAPCDPLADPLVTVAGLETNWSPFVVCTYFNVLSCLDDDGGVDVLD